MPVSQRDWRLSTAGGADRDAHHRVQPGFQSGEVGAQPTSAVLRLPKRSPTNTLAPSAITASNTAPAMSHQARRDCEPGVTVLTIGWPAIANPG